MPRDARAGPGIGTAGGTSSCIWSALIGELIMHKNNESFDRMGLRFNNGGYTR